MDSGLARAFLGVVLVAGFGVAVRDAPAQPTDQPSAGPPPVDTSPAGGAPAEVPQIPMGPSPATDATNAASATNEATDTSPPTIPPSVAKPPAPPAGPPLPLRTPSAVMQVLDKVTGETLQFEAPIGRPIRYKTLVMTVRVCETRGAKDPQPRPSAYIEMDTRAPAVPGHEPPPPKRVFDGWMFANAPAVHPLEHPIYDAWLVACSPGGPAER
jgi:hypothetical protein